jgi:hypothetical protein
MDAHEGRRNMFSGIPDGRFGNLTPNELRWLDNIKKAFYESDKAYAESRPQDRCMEELCKAVDTAKTLRRSLRGEDVSNKENKKRFIEFVHLEIPSPSTGGVNVQLLDVRTQKPLTYSYGELVYAIRCMVHENENLDAADNPDYHIQLDWNRSPYFGVLHDGKLILNGPAFWNRLREVMAKFITGVDSMIGLAQGSRTFNIGIAPPLGSIKPERTTKKDALA